MSGTRGYPSEFECLTCKTVRNGFWWTGDEFSNATNWNMKELQKGCGNPNCTYPHLTKRIRGGRIGMAQVSSDQRAVVYLYPDGDYGSPWTNDPNDEQAKIMRGDGAVRMEFPHLRDLVVFQREQANRALEQYQRDIDDGLYEDSGLTPDFKQLRDAIYERARNQVIEYDKASLDENRHRVTEKIKEARERRSKLQESVKTMRERIGMRIGSAEDSRRYERLRGKR